MSRNTGEDKKETFFDAYNRYLSTYPFFINGIQAAVISTLAIVASAYLTSTLKSLKVGGLEKESYHDQILFIYSEFQAYVFQKKSVTLPLDEIIIMALVNFFFMTPVLLSFGDFLGKINEGFMAGQKSKDKKENSKEKQKSGWSSNQIIWINVFIDQFLFSPFFTAAIISLRHYGYHWNDWVYFSSSLLPFLKEVLPTALLYSWCFWIPVKFFMFATIPAIYQLLVGSCFAFVWNMIFTLVVS